MFAKMVNLILGIYSVVCYFVLLNFSRKNDKKIEVMVFSYDRPGQLFSLLKSLQKHGAGVEKINIVYRSSNTEFEDAYQYAFDFFSEVFQINSYCENTSGFKSTLLKAISNITSAYVLFFMDDQVAYKDFSLGKLSSMLNHFSIVTMRLGMNTRWCYTLKKEQFLPKFKDHKTYFSWLISWKEDDFNYPFSLDATCFPTNLIKRLFSVLYYKAPNSLEGALNLSKSALILLRVRMASFKTQRVVNFVIGKVQEENENTSLDMCKYELLDRFLKGEYITVDPLSQDSISSPHQESGFAFKLLEEKEEV